MKRDIAIQAIRELIGTKILKYEFNQALLVALDELRKNEQRPRGKWLPFDIGAFSNAGRECSNCGKRFQLNVNHNYCPNCGADMRGEE